MENSSAEIRAGLQQRKGHPARGRAPIGAVLISLRLDRDQRFLPVLGSKQVANLALQNESIKILC